MKACKEKHIPIRIGINGGSLEKDIHEKYGKPTAQGMIESAKRHVQILEDLDFYDTVLSFKPVIHYFVLKPIAWLPKPLITHYT